jgi:hypothetical protein
MKLEELLALLERTVEDFRASPTHWQFAHQDIPMACLVDANFDRMRFIAPITETADLDDASKEAVLEANFHTALDARYASSNGLLFAAFIHPLGSLDERLARSALDQVASLVLTFGNQYTSGSLEFVGPDHPDDGEEDAEADDQDEDDDGPLWN